MHEIGVLGRGRPGIGGGWSCSGHQQAYPQGSTRRKIGCRAPAAAVMHLTRQQMRCLPARRRLGHDNSSLACQFQVPPPRPGAPGLADRMPLLAGFTWTWVTRLAVAWWGSGCFSDVPVNKCVQRRHGDFRAGDSSPMRRLSPCLRTPTRCGGSAPGLP